MPPEWTLIRPVYTSCCEGTSRQLELGERRRERPRVEARCAGELVSARRTVAKPGEHRLSRGVKVYCLGRGAGEPEEVQHVGGRRQRRRAELEQVVRPGRKGGRDLPGNGEHLAPLLECEVGRDQRAASFASLDHDRGRREPRDDPVACRKAPWGRLDARRVL